MTEYEVRVSDEDVCDFCSEPKPTRRFELPDFTLDSSHDGLPEYRSRGAWAACSQCGTLIDERDWVGLVTRATDRLMPKYQGVLPRRIVRAQIEMGHQKFREHYERTHQR